MPIKRRFDQFSPETACPAPVPPLGEVDLALVKRAIAEIAPDWAVALEGICADEANLVLVPDDGDDRSGPSFVISRNRCGLRVDQVHWDVVTEVGVFDLLHHAVEVLRLRLVSYIDITVPAFATLH